MNQMDAARWKKRTSPVRWLLLGATTLLVVAVLATAGYAGTPGTSTAGLAISIEQGLTPALTGVLPVMRGIVVPTRPTARSPFQPPTWIAVKPPWVH